MQHLNITETMWILSRLAISARAQCALNLGVLIILVKSTGVEVVWGMFIHKHKEHYHVIAVMSWVTYLAIVQETKLGTRYRCHSCPLPNNERRIACRWRQNWWCAAFSTRRHGMFPVSANRCLMWRKQRVVVMTINGLSQTCCGEGTLTISDEKGDIAETDVLVMQDKPFGYDLLLGIDAIRAFGGVMITAAEGVTLGRGKEVFVAIYIEEKHFYATFDNEERAWTARWKWATNEAPDQLCNTIPEYAVSN